MAVTEVLGGGIEGGLDMVKTVAGGTLGVLAVGKSLFRVRQGERAVKEDFGAKVRLDGNGAPKIYHPGVHMVFPGF